MGLFKTRAKQHGVSDGTPLHMSAAEWTQEAPWRRWGTAARDASTEMLAQRLASLLHLDERDVMIVEEQSVTLLWWLWQQPVYISLTTRDGTTAVRAGCTVLGFSDLDSARAWAFQHNATTTLWSWYAEPVSDHPAAGLWRSFTRLAISSEETERDLLFAAEVLKDFAADMQLKHGNNLAELSTRGDAGILIAMPAMVHPLRPLQEYSDTTRSQKVFQHRLMVAEHAKTHGNGFVGKVTPAALAPMLDLSELFSASVEPDGDIVAVLGSSLEFEPSSLAIVMLRTDVPNPAMGRGLLVHVALPVDVNLSDMESLTAGETFSRDVTAYLGAWSTDPLNLWEAALGFPSVLQGAAQPPLRAAHTAFYPSHYSSVRNVDQIVRELVKRLTRTPR